VTVTLKLATSLDGRIATASGESRWITGEAAREQVHRLRAEHDAVMVGIETALADDPELTVRLPRYDGLQPARVILDSRQRLPLDSRLVASARDLATYVVSARAPTADLARAGVQVVQVESGADGRPDLTAAVAALAKLGLNALLVEGGGQVAASLLACDLVDRIEWFRAPIILGSGGHPSVGGLTYDALAGAPRFRRAQVETLGPDVWERYERA
jgi:diaminohydroxyphosphoribosylaminopyrimidine deaminase/5-amino-6-(5-phosphoribosylamino)uracil reductase